MPVACTFCCRIPFPSISDDLIPKMGTFLYLITNTRRSSEKAVAVVSRLYPLEWSSAAKGRLKTSGRTIPFSADTWS